MFYLFHCCPGLYVIGCLGQYLIYFIAAHGDIPLVAWADILFISLLPRVLFHWLPGQCFIYFLAAQGYISLVAWADILFISLLPRALFHWLPGQIFCLFHCCVGRYFIGCLGRYFIYFIAA